MCSLDEECGVADSGSDITLETSEMVDETGYRFAQIHWIVKMAIFDYSFFSQHFDYHFYFLQKQFALQLV